jgi:hypothetical protein
VPSTEVPKYWFPAKRYGWGWGFPSVWQGWAIVAAYLALILGGIPFLHVPKGSVAYLAYVAVLTALLVGICWLKGEPPRWRWGGRDP